MKSTIILLKIGGSIITDKNKPLTLKPALITDLARQIKKALKEQPQLQLIIGNGGGSFAHFAAQKYQWQRKALATSKEHLWGQGQVQAAASRLNHYWRQALLAAKIPVFTLQPSAFLLSKKGEISQFFLSPLQYLLQQGAIPLIYGDILLDQEKGAHIFSTEKLFFFLAQQLRRQGYPLRQIIQLTAVDGLFDDQGKLVARLTAAAAEKWSFFQPAPKIDVTGGMEHKLKQAAFLARQGITTLIINGKKENRLYRALCGKEVRGTVIVPPENNFAASTK